MNAELKIANKAAVDAWLWEHRENGAVAVKDWPPEGATYADGEPIKEKVNFAWRDVVTGETIDIQYHGWGRGGFNTASASAELDADLVAIQVCGTCICNYLSHDPDEYGHHGYCPIDQQRKVKEFLLSPQSPYETLRQENARLRGGIEEIIDAVLADFSQDTLWIESRLRSLLRLTGRGSDVQKRNV